MKYIGCRRYSLTSNSDERFEFTLDDPADDPLQKMCAIVYGVALSERIKVVAYDFWDGMGKQYIATCVFLSDCVKLAIADTFIGTVTYFNTKPIFEPVHVALQNDGTDFIKSGKFSDFSLLS